MNRFRRTPKFSFSHEREKFPLNIVGDAAIAASPYCGGKFIPLIIVDTSERPDLEELVTVHERFPSGDVDTQWVAFPRVPESVGLAVSFSGPIRLVAIFAFDIVNQGILVDQILGVKAMYLQAGRPGDRFLTNPSASRIFVEVTAGGFAQQWEKLWHKRISADMRSKGLARSDAKRAASQAIESVREVGKFRMK